MGGREGGGRNKPVVFKDVKTVCVRKEDTVHEPQRIPPPEEALSFFGEST
jgi:hypothetical protein